MGDLGLGSPLLHPHWYTDTSGYACAGLRGGDARAEELSGSQRPTRRTWTATRAQPVFQGHCGVYARPVPKGHRDNATTICTSFLVTHTCHRFCGWQWPVVPGGRTRIRSCFECPLPRERKHVEEFNRQLAPQKGSCLRCEAVGPAEQRAHRPRRPMAPKGPLGAW